MTDLFGHSVRLDCLVLYILEASLCFAAAYCVLVLGLPQGGASGFHAGAAVIAAFVALATGVVGAATGMHDPERWSPTQGLLPGSVLTALLLLPLAWSVVAFLDLKLGRIGGDGHRGTMVLLLAGVGAGTAALTRLAFSNLTRAGLFTQHVALFGREPDVPEIADSAQFRVVMRVQEDFGRDTGPLLERLHAGSVRMVLVGQSVTVPAVLHYQLDAAGIHVLNWSSFLERQHRRVTLATLDTDWLRTANGAQDNTLEAGVRRVFDVLVSIGLLFLTLPVTLLAVLAIRLEGPGPIFYRQERVGRGGRRFHLLKLRSMRVDAEAGGVPQWATQRDARVTRVGRILRLMRVDEIPQVLNVLWGDMAFIGPRPERPAFVEQLAAAIPHYNDRTVVKPGITGWAQVNYPYGASVEDARQKLAYDLYYIRCRSLFLDLLILVATVRVVLFQEGSR